MKGKLNIQIQTENLEDLAPVLRQYPGQSGPQGAFIEIQLGEGGAVARADYNPEVGNAVPESVWHRRALRIPIDCELKGSAIKSRMESPEFLAALKVIARGYTEKMDSNCNHIGSLAPKALAAVDEIAEMFADPAEDEMVSLYESSEYWYQDWSSSGTSGEIYGHTITAKTTDDEIEAIAEDLTDTVAHDIRITDDTAKWLRGLRDELEPLEEDDEDDEAEGKEAAYEAISLSIRENRIVHLDYDPAVREVLVVECDDNAPTGGGNDEEVFWGEDEVGNTWRVHMAPEK